jgi:hypothetical protein
MLFLFWQTWRYGSLSEILGFRMSAKVANVAKAANWFCWPPWEIFRTVSVAAALCRETRFWRQNAEVVWWVGVAVSWRGVLAATEGWSGRVDELCRPMVAEGDRKQRR